MALGARKTQVLRLILREGLALIADGTGTWVLGCVRDGKILSALNNDFAKAFKIGTNDTRLLVGAPLLLPAIAILACYLPAHRTAKVDPLSALRQP